MARQAKIHKRANDLIAGKRSRDASHEPNSSHIDPRSKRAIPGAPSTSSGGFHP